MTKNPDVEPFNSLIQGHFGVHIKGEQAFKIILDDPAIQQIIWEAQESFQRESGLRMRSLDPDGYDHDDRYCFPKHEVKPTLGKAYDASGQLIPHVVAFEKAAQALMEANPNIVANATRTGIEISYLNDSTDENIRKSNK